MTSARLELDDLPPRYRAQAEAQIAARQRESAPMRSLWRRPQVLPDG